MQSLAPALDIATTYPSHKLLKLPLFQARRPHLSEEEQINLSYKRAQAIGREYALTTKDVLHLSPKFWQLHRDPMSFFDSAATTLLTIQYNLFAGLLAPYALKRPDLQPLMQRTLNFDISAQFLLTEVSHGLDAQNLETTAILLPDGSFDLHSPNAGAGKWMPPAMPRKDFERVGIVIARLVVDSKDRGIRPFIVALSDGERMCKGITTKAIPRRCGSKPVDHGLTMFDHVKLPPTALLGSLGKPASIRLNFLSTLWRVAIGGLCLTSTTIGALKSAVYIAGKYSQRRCIGNPQQGLNSVINFRTQQQPIIHTLAHIAVLEAFTDSCTEDFMTNDSVFVKHGLATCYKAHVAQVTQKNLYELSERCGSQGLFEFNQIIEMQLESRGVNIAEGDVLVLCIRLASELLIGRYSMPAPKDPLCLLAKHEAGLFAEARAYLAEAQGVHRSDHFNHFVLPLCQPLIEAIGQRMAYEAAVAANVHPAFLKLYEVGMIGYDASWYAENLTLTRRQRHVIEDEAISEIVPHLDKLLEQLHIKDYVYAPIVSEESWDLFVEGLKTIGGGKKHFKSRI